MERKWKDIKDKEGNHYIISHEKDNIIYLTKMITAEEANEKGLNGPDSDKLLGSVYIEDLAKDYNILIIKFER